MVPASLAAGGAVPKWLKGTVCKTVIHRFESGPRLHSPLSIHDLAFHANKRLTGAAACYLAYLKTKKAAPEGAAFQRFIVSTNLESFVENNVPFNTNLVGAYTTFEEVSNLLYVL